ncbi:MAG: TPR end-of-group domain-containing protein [Candidatus Dormibacteraceae bacterium]
MIRDALEAQRQAEQDFVAHARDHEKAPKGWPAALILFHASMWRERLLHALTEMAEDRPQPPFPGSVDEINEAELASGIGTPLADAAARSEKLLGEIIAVYEKLGDRPIQWGSVATTTEAVLRNSYIHPRNHMFEYLNENGDAAGAARVFEEAVRDMREADAPPLILGAAVYNLACLRATQERTKESLALLEEATRMRTDLKAAAADDAQLASLRDDPGFQALVKR